MSAPAPKKPLRIDVTLRRVEEAVREYPKAALFELAEQGYGSPFEILVACILSIRTRDKTTLRRPRVCSPPPARPRRWPGSPSSSSTA